MTMTFFSIYEFSKVFKVKAKQNGNYSEMKKILFSIIVCVCVHSLHPNSVYGMQHHCKVTLSGFFIDTKVHTNNHWELSGQWDNHIALEVRNSDDRDVSIITQSPSTLPLLGYKKWSTGWSGQHGPAYTTRYSCTQAGKQPITANT